MVINKDGKMFVLFLDVMFNDLILDEIFFYVLL